MTNYFNMNDSEVEASKEYPNHINYSQGIWFDQRTGELMTRDKMIWDNLNYWYQCYLHIEEQRKGKVWKWEKPRHEYKYKHRNSVSQTAKLMGIHQKVIESLNKLYQCCDCEGVCSFEAARQQLGKDWKRALKNLARKDLIKMTSDSIRINPSFVLTRDNWPTESKREALKQKYEQTKQEIK